MFDPIFNVLTWLLERFYDFVPSYGFAIIALTVLVLGVLSPLTYRSTKSMVQMRQLQPQIKRLQKKHKGDREQLNQEMMALYQEHSVSPLSGCLPILIQSPVFFIMFRVIRGITRRSSDLGFDAGGLFGAKAVASELGVRTSFSESISNKFNPEYLDKDSAIYQALINDNEMMWLGIDLSRTPLEVVQNDLGSAFPYLASIALVAVLGWYQQRQIQGRMTGEVSSQQQMIMKILPWMLPIFSFTMPGGLVLYFIVSAALRITQQAYITRAVYQNEELNAPIDFGNDDDDDDLDDDDDEPENPLAALFGGGSKSSKPKGEPAPAARHGSRRPTSSSSGKRSRPASTSAPAKKSGSPSKRTTAKDASAKDGKNSTDSKASKKRSASNGAAPEKVSGWGRAKRSAPQSNEKPAKPVSRRVTQKGDSSPKNRRGKK